MGSRSNNRFGAHRNLFPWLIAVTALGTAALLLRLDERADIALADRRIASVDFHGDRLEDAIHRLGAAAGENVVVDRQSFEYGNLDEPVRLQLHDVTFDSALRALSPSQLRLFKIERRGASFCVVLIEQETSTTCVYDFGPLLRKWIAGRRYVPRPEIRAFEGGFERSPLQPLSEAEWMEELFRLIRANIHPPLSWDAEGGYETIRVVGQALIITSPRATHREIRELITNLWKIASE